MDRTPEAVIADAARRIRLALVGGTAVTMDDLDAIPPPEEFTMTAVLESRACKLSKRCPCAAGAIFCAEESLSQAARCGCGCTSWKTRATRLSAG